MIETLISFYVLATATLKKNAFSPGPDNIFVLNTEYC